MENQALISVIIPVYNVEKYLHECVDSIINQTYKNLEIILVDDGSTDSSGKICDEYAERDNRITVIHKENGGLSLARNAGFNMASGDYAYFLDSDDYIVAHALETLAEIAAADSSDIVYFDAVSFADSEDFKVKQNYIRENIYKKGLGFDILTELQNRGDYHSAVQLLFFRRGFLKEQKLSFVPEVYHEDMIFTYEAFCVAKTVSQCREALYFRRYRKDSIMTSKKSKKHFLSLAAVYRGVRDYSFDNNIQNSSTAKKYITRCAFNALNTYKLLTKQERKECRRDYERLKKDIMSDGAYGDSSLKMRCRGKLFWFIYKIFEKTAGRFLKGKK